jgi:hypothetical protein
MGFTPYCFADDSATRNYAAHHFLVVTQHSNKKPAGFDLPVSKRD